MGIALSFAIFGVEVLLLVRVRVFRICVGVGLRVRVRVRSVKTYHSICLSLCVPSKYNFGFVPCPYFFV